MAEIEIAERRAERFGDEAEGKMQKRNEIRNSKSRLKMIRKVEEFALRETRTHLRSKLLPRPLRMPAAGTGMREALRERRRNGIRNLKVN